LPCVSLCPGSGLYAGPNDVCEGSGGFPAGSTPIPLELLPCSKPYLVSTGASLINIASPASLYALPGVGTAGNVTQAHTLYLRTNVPVIVALTFLGGASAQQLNVNGLLIIEADPAHPITGVSVQAAQAQVEYLAVGNL
jgi:hypothetical protein